MLSRKKTDKDYDECFNEEYIEDQDEEEYDPDDEDRFWDRDY